MADDEELAEDQDDFAGDDEDDEEPDELADGPLEEDLDDDEAVFDPDLAEEAEESLEVAEVAVDEDAEEDGEPPRRAAVGEEEEDDDDLVDPDDVEADLDTILKDRLVAAEDTPDEDEEEAEPEDRGETGDRLQPKRADEQLCPSCFLLVRRTAPACPMGADEDCPLFS